MNPKEFVKEYCIKSLVCCFSGGKDSLVATHYTLSELANVNDIDKYVAFVDTTVMLPIAQPFVEDVCKRFGWNLKILRPQNTFWEQAEKKGIPWIRRRWCCYGLKLQPIFDFVRHLPPQRGEIVGIRGDEKHRLNYGPRQVWYDKRRGVNAWQYLPLFDWTKKDVLRYVKDNDLPMPPQYRLGIKETCMCGAFSSKKQIEILRGQFPELFQKFVELEGKFRSDWACFWRGKPLYAKDLAKQKTLGET